jgi:polysaccharide pyruvyl transferase WcaK-like protein
MRIALWNGSGLDNVGDRLINAVTRQELEARIPDAQCHSFSPWPGPVTPDRLTIDKKGYWNAHGQFDVIVVGGGALIGGPPFLDPVNQYFLLGPYPERFQDPALIVWNGMCSDVQTLAPTEERWRKFVCTATDRVSLLTVRNSRTCSFLRECGVTKPIQVVPDAAILAAEPWERPETRGKLRIACAPGRPVFPEKFLTRITANAFANVGSINPDVVRIVPYSPAASFDDHEYASSLADRLKEISDADFFLFGSDSMYGDSITAELMAGQLEGSTYVSLTDPLGADTIARSRTMDCVIAFRLHSCIMALIVGTPFIAVDLYRNEITGTSKLHQLMKDAGLESRYLTIDEVVSDNRRLSNLAQDVVAQGREPVINAHSKLAAQARSHFDALAETIVKHGCLQPGMLATSPA